MTCKSVSTRKLITEASHSDPVAVEVPKPIVVEDRDVIVKITGSTVCGSDLHLLHGTVIQLQKGDILGHEFCGVVDSVGSAVSNVKPGDRVVASFQIACGDVCLNMIMEPTCINARSIVYVLQEEMVFSMRKDKLRHP